MQIALVADAAVFLQYYVTSGTNNQSVQGSASQYWPALNSALKALQSGDFALTGDVVTTKLVRKYNGKTPIQSVTETYQLTPEKARTVGYSKRRKSGEVFMNPYAAGEVLVERRIGVVNLPELASGPLAAQKGWLIGNRLDDFFAKYGASLPPIPPTRNGAPLRGYQALLSWRWVEVPDNSVYLSPAFVPPVAVPPIVISEGLVTSVVADASNGEFDLSTELMELPETMGFLGESVKQALVLTADIEEDVRKARKRVPGAKLLEKISNIWLKGRYALLPILYSIQDIQKVLETMDREYGRYSSKADVSSLFEGVSVPGCVVHFEHNATARCVMKVRYTITSLLENLRRAININLLSSLWEVTTLSFVADWAFNIGDFITAASGSTGATDMCTAYVVKDTSTMTVTYDNDTMPVSTTVKLKLYRREIINPYDHIGLEFVLGRNLNWKRCIDAFALAARPGIRRFESVLKRQGAI